MLKLAIHSTLLANDSWRRHFSNNFRSCGLEDIWFDELESANINFSETHAVVTGRSWKLDQLIIDTVISLRLALAFTGPIIVLSFTPITLVHREEEIEALRTDGCTYLQLPFEMSKFVHALTLGPITGERFEYVRSQFAVVAIKRKAREIEHSFGNKLSNALTYLHEIEKLRHQSHNIGDLDQYKQHVQSCLTRESVENFRSEIVDYLGMKGNWSLPLAAEPLEIVQDWISIEKWLDICEARPVEPGNNVQEIFERAKETEMALRRILSIVRF